MRRTLLILAACLFACAAAGGAGLQVTGQPAGVLGSPRAAAVPVWLPLTEKPDVTQVEPGPSSGESPAAAPLPAARKTTAIVQEITAGALTGSLAAVLMLKLLLGRRRNED